MPRSIAFNRAHLSLPQPSRLEMTEAKAVQALGLQATFS